MKKTILIVCLGLLSSFSNTQSVEKWLTTSDKSALFEKQKGKLEFKKGETDSPTIYVDHSKRFQTMDGFGFTITDGSAGLINQLKNKGELLQELFRTKNNEIRISYLRLSIGASDLISHVFIYNESSSPDPENLNFSLAEEQKDLIPLIKEILHVNPEIKILGSPWTPPALDEEQQL